MKTILIAAAIVANVIPRAALSQTVELDTAFGENGIVIHAVGDNNDEIRAITLQPDGKIIAAGLSYADPVSRCALARYLPDGTLDATFFGDGMLTDSFSASSCSYHGVALQNDGKIVAAGFTRVVFKDDFALARYEQNGVLDATFGNSGKVVTDFFGDDDDVFAMTIQPDGKIVVAGSAYDSTHLADFALARYNIDGSLDASFGNAGKVHFDFGTSACQATSLAMQADGKLVVGGYHSVNNISHFAIARVTANGSLDPTFGVDGKQVTMLTANTSRSYSIALQPDGKIVIAGFVIAVDPYYDFAVVRYLTDGTPDSTFSDDGIVITSVNPYIDYAHALTIQQDGKIVVAGATSGTGLQNDFLLVRYNPDGTLDGSFGIDGHIITQVSAGYETIYAVRLQPDGKLVAGGFAEAGSKRQFALARYTADIALGLIDFDNNKNDLVIYPNPIDREAALSYELEAEGIVSITLFDMQGRLLKHFLFNEYQPAGKHSLVVSLGEEFSPGSYILQLSGTSGQVAVKVVKP